MKACISWAVVCVLFSCAQASGQTQDAAALRKLEKDWADAVVTGDPAKIGRFFTEDFLFVGAGGVLQNRKEHLADFKTGKLKVQSITLGDPTIHVLGDFAVVSAPANLHGTFAGRDITGAYRFMDTWQRQGKQWLAVSRQQTKVATGPAADSISPYLLKSRDLYLNEGKPAAARRVLPPSALKLKGQASLQPATVRSKNGRLDVELEVR